MAGGSFVVVADGGAGPDRGQWQGDCHQREDVLVEFEFVDKVGCYCEDGYK